MGYRGRGGGEKNNRIPQLGAAIEWGTRPERGSSKTGPCSRKEKKGCLVGDLRAIHGYEGLLRVSQGKGGLPS